MAARRRDIPRQISAEEAVDDGDAIRGHPSNEGVREDLHRKLGALVRNKVWICVGTTSLGRKGLEDHFNDKFRTLGFDHIRPVYSTSSPKSAAQVKKHILEYIFSKDYRDKLIKVRRPSAPPKGQEHLVYVASMSESRREELSEANRVSSDEAVQKGDPATGRPTDPEVAEALRRKMASIVSQGKAAFYVGKTSRGLRGVKERYNQKYRAMNFDKIVPLYKSSSADNASIVERDLIEHAETAPYFLLMYNEVGGGGGRVSEAAGREGHVVYLASMSLEMERRLVPEAGDT